MVYDNNINNYYQYINSSFKLKKKKKKKTEKII